MNEQYIVIAVDVVDDTRCRSSTNSSLEFIDDYFGESEIKKEWEVSVFERSILGILIGRGMK